MWPLFASMLHVIHLTSITVLGFWGGWMFYRIWRRLLPREHSREFWRRMPEDIRGMLNSEETQDMLNHYRALLIAVARYAGRSVVAVLAGIAPLAAAYLLFELMPFGQTAHTDRNPLAPHLSDADFVLLACAAAGSAVAAWRMRAPQPARP